MRVFEKRVERVERDNLYRVSCDLCGKAAPSLGTVYPWEEGRFDVTDTVVQVRLKSGKQYPEGGSGPLWAVDVCPECFQEKLLPWAASFGFRDDFSGEWDA